MKKALAIILAVWAVCTCTPQDASYIEYYNKAYKADYPQKAANLTGEAGYLRAILSWDAPVSPTSTQAIIYWNFEKDSLLVDLKNPAVIKDSRVCVSIENLEETDYTFDVFIIDIAGSRSLVNEVLVAPKGPDYVHELTARTISSAVLSEIDAAGVVNWGDKTRSLVFSELKYTDNKGAEKILKVDPSDLSVVISDMDMTNLSDFAYRSVFLTSECIDTLRSVWVNGSWVKDPDYSLTLGEGVECITFRTRKNGTVTPDADDPNMFVIECTTSATSFYANELQGNIQGSVLVFQYKQTLASSSTKIYLVDKGGSVDAKRLHSLDLSKFAYGDDRWHVAVVDMYDTFTKYLYAGNPGDYARIDMTTTAGNVITIRNAHFREPVE